MQDQNSDEIYAAADKALVASEHSIKNAMQPENYNAIVAHMRAMDAMIAEVKEVPTIVPPELSAACVDMSPLLQLQGALTEQQAALRQDIFRLSEVNQLMSNVADLQARLNASQQEVTELRNSWSQLCNTRHDVHAAYNRLKAYMQRGADRWDTLRSKHNTLTGAYATVKDELDILTSDYNKTVDLLKNKYAEVEKLQEQLNYAPDKRLIISLVGVLVVITAVITHFLTVAFN